MKPLHNSKMLWRRNYIGHQIHAHFTMAQVSVHVLYGDIVCYSEFDDGFEGDEYLYRKNATGTKVSKRYIIKWLPW